MMANKSMIASLDEVSFIQGFLLPEAMHKISHDRGMIGPARRGLFYLSVTPEEPMPYAMIIPTCQTHRFTSETRNDQAETRRGILDKI
jgi:hypothetical protein